MRLVLAGGGTGGHLFPGIAIAEEALRRESTSEILFIGAPYGLDSKIVPAHHFSLEIIPVGGLKRVGIAQQLKTFSLLQIAILKSVAILKRFDPDAVIGLGGYSAGPVILAAKLLRVPTGILENNTIPGFTNKQLSKVVDHVFVAFEEAKGKFPAKKIILSGNPVRGSISTTPLPPKEEFTIGILGGSQGARRLNQIIVQTLPLLDPSIKIIHQTGVHDIQWVKEGYDQINRQAEVIPFVDDMASFYKKISLAICRAGATTISELAAAGRPAIFIPFPFAADDHQTWNAKAIEKLGGGRVIIQDQLTPRGLVSIVNHFRSHYDELVQMAKKIQVFHHAQATQTILNAFK